MARYLLGIHKSKIVSSVDHSFVFRIVLSEHGKIGQETQTPDLNPYSMRRQTKDTHSSHTFHTLPFTFLKGQK